MNISEIIILGAGVSMDAFSVSICKGLGVQKLKLSYSLICGAYFGFFQMIMPLIGFLLGTGLSSAIKRFDHWIAFLLLVFIGGKTLWEAFHEEEGMCGDFSIKSMFPLAIATSIDAMAVGVSFAFLEVDIIPSVIVIGILTFSFSAFGVLIGHYFGEKFKKPSVILGGIVLIAIGIKILIAHSDHLFL